jgi:hypothetical protein
MSLEYWKAKGWVEDANGELYKPKPGETVHLGVDPGGNTGGVAAVVAHDSKGKTVRILGTFDMRPSTDEEKLNKTERRFLTHLRLQKREWIGIQCITLKLADDCRFTADFWVFDSGKMFAYDVKATWKKKNGERKVHVEDDALVKIKTAARTYPFFHFFLAFEPNGANSGWEEKEIRS